MKYKIGDKIVIKNDLDTSDWIWEIREAYYGLNPKIVTIIDTPLDYYELKEFEGSWYDEEIVGLYEEPEPQDPDNLINSRFEILDL